MPRVRTCFGAVALAVVFTACAGEDPELSEAAPAASTTTTAFVEEVSEETLVGRARGDALVAFSEPDDNTEPVAVLPNPTETGGALVVRIVSPASDLDQEWLEALLPIRPNGTTGWIRASDVELNTTPYRVEIDVSDFNLTVYDGADVLIDTPIAVGTGDTPTPYGDFYLAELLQPPTDDGPYGPFAFGLNGYSEVLDTFAGGNGVIGIHGTNEPSAIGSEVSHGCVRVENDVITQLAETLPLGTPVSIST